MARIYLNGVLVDVLHQSTHIAENFDHAADIADIGNIFNAADVLRKQGCGNNSNGGILCAAYINRAAQPVAALYYKLFQNSSPLFTAQCGIASQSCGRRAERAGKPNFARSRPLP